MPYGLADDDDFLPSGRRMPRTEPAVPFLTVDIVPFVDAYRRAVELLSRFARPNPHEQLDAAHRDVQLLIQRRYEEALGRVTGHRDDRDIAWHQRLGDLVDAHTLGRTTPMDGDRLRTAVLRQRGSETPGTDAVEHLARLEVIAEDVAAALRALAFAATPAALWRLPDGDGIA